MKYIPTPNSIRIRFYRCYNRWYFRWKGICFGRNLTVYNKVYVTGYAGVGRIAIGDNFHFTSGDGINPICRNLRGCIHLGSKQAEIVIGNNVGMSSTCIWVNNRLTIGNNVNIGGNCTILDTDTHQIDYQSRRGEKRADSNNPYTTIQSAPITIEDDVWIGANCIILKGVTIGARSVVGAGSVVTKSIPADCIAAGNPCKVLKIMK
ncbi:MAG: acyltransferase [Prevotella sp.]|nr:acyltransferase [Prevotella sp.]